VSCSCSSKESETQNLHGYFYTVQIRKFLMAAIRFDLWLGIIVGMLVHLPDQELAAHL